MSRTRVPPGTSGAYELHILVTDHVTIRLSRRTGKVGLPPGCYVYFGSAKSGVHERIAHHRAVDRGERRGRHWHVDRLLELPAVRITRAVAHAGADECELCLKRKRRGRFSVPVKGFGSTDCRAGCGSHLLRVTVHGVAGGP